MQIIRACVCITLVSKILIFPLVSSNTLMRRPKNPTSWKRAPGNEDELVYKRARGKKKGNITSDLEIKIINVVRSWQNFRIRWSLS